MTEKMTTKERLEELLKIVNLKHWTREEEMAQLWILIQKEEGEVK